MDAANRGEKKHSVGFQPTAFQNMECLLLNANLTLTWITYTEKSCVQILIVTFIACRPLPLLFLISADSLYSG